MGDYLNNIQLADTYKPEATVGPDNSADHVAIAVSGAPVLAQFMQKVAGGNPSFDDREFLIVAGTNTIQSLIARNVQGARFRNATPGSSARIIAHLAGRHDVQFEGSSLLSGAFGTTGGVVGTSGVPTGAVLPFAGSVLPSGFVFCDGTHYDGTTTNFKNLFTVIGNTYGGAAQTDMAVPDYRGRSPVGVGTHADVSTLGANDGAALANRRPKHSHSGAGLTFTGTAGTTGIENQAFNHNYARKDTAGSTALNFAAGGIGNVIADGVTATENQNHNHNFTPAGTITGSVGPAGMTDSGGYITCQFIIAL